MRDGQSVPSRRAPGHCEVLFKYAELRGWCAPGIALGIQRPASRGAHNRPKGPKWTEVRRLIASARDLLLATSAPKLFSFYSRFTVYEAVRWRSSNLVISTGTVKRSRYIAQSAVEFSSFQSNMKLEKRSSVTYNTVGPARQQITFSCCRATPARTNSPSSNAPACQHKNASVGDQTGATRSSLSPSCLRNPFAKERNITSRDCRFSRSSKPEDSEYLRKIRHQGSPESRFVQHGWCPMKLHEGVDAYVEGRRTYGAVYPNGIQTLSAFCRYAGNVPLDI